MEPRLRSVAHSRRCTGSEWLMKNLAHSNSMVRTGQHTVQLSKRLAENGWERGEGEPTPTPISAILAILGCIECHRLPSILPRVFPFLLSENHVAHLEKTLVC